MIMHWNEFFEENEMIDVLLDKHGHQGSQEIFQPKLH